MRLDRLLVRVSADEVRQVLSEVTERLDGGFTVDDAHQFATRLANAGPDDDLLIESTVTYCGQPHPFVLDVLFEDDAPPELAVLASGPVVSLVVEQLRSCLGERDVRVLRAGGDA